MVPLKGLKMKKALFIVLIASGLLFLTSCATIFSGSSDEVTILSSPDDADVYINGMRYGSTPMIVSLAKGNTYYVELRKEGYDSRKVIITSEVGIGWVVLDVIAGLVPLVIDIATDAWSELTPDLISIQL